MSERILAVDKPIRPANGKARRYHVRLDHLVRLGEMPASTACITVVPLDDHNHLLSELFREQRKVGLLQREVERLRTILAQQGQEVGE